MAYSDRLWLKTQRYLVRIPAGSDVCHRGCAYTVLQTVQRLGVYSAVYDTTYNKEPLKSSRYNYFALNFTNVRNFYPLEVVNRGSETQLQVGRNVNL